MSELPIDLETERIALEKEIYDAFDGVTREGGASWREADVIDNYGSDQEREEARRRDRDKTWKELADCRDWSPGTHEWSFLDPIGFRYYLPAALVQWLLRGDEAFVTFGLDIILRVDYDNVLGPHAERELVNYKIQQLSLLTDRQRRCVARFLRFAIAYNKAAGSDIEAEFLQRVYDRYWRTVA